VASGRDLFVQWLSAHPVPVKEQDRIADSWALDVGERVSTRQRSSDHSCSGHRSGSLTDGCDEFPLFAVLAEQMVDDILLRRGVQQHWEENFFLHGLMILIAKEPKERQHRPDIENFDTVSMFHDVNHPVENVQPPPENRMVSCDNFRTLHKPPVLSF